MAYAYRMSGRSGQRNSNQRQPKQRGAGQYIHPSKFINKAVVIKQEDIFEPTHVFKDFDFQERILQNLEKRGYEKPTPIQDGAMPAILDGRDLIGLANTGTGKTAAFVLPILHRIATNAAYQVLVMAPTRELAQQIEEETRKFSAGIPLLTAICVGGVNIDRQKRALAKDPHIIIGTPGRLKDLIQQGSLVLDMCDTLVLDEADRMLDMGFLPDIKDIISELPEKRQSLCFSATITPEISRLLDGLLKDPVTVSVRVGETSEHIEQDIIVAATKEDKIERLMELLGQPDYGKVLVFTQTKHAAQRLAEILSKDGIPADAIHGNKTQSQRERALRNFKEHRARVLVATDVAARGLDVPSVSHVINFDQPNTYEDYVHRIGRTGRAGKSGKAWTFVAQRP